MEGGDKETKPADPAQASFYDDKGKHHVPAQ